MSLASLLSPIQATHTLLTSRVVHQSLYPYTLFTTLHAIRVTVAFQNNVRASSNKGKLTWGNYISGYLIMAWGGSFIAHLLMSLPPPILYNYQPYVNYISVHLLATAFFHVYPNALDMQILDSLFTPLDAILRSTAVASHLRILTSGALPPTHAPMVISSITPILIGAIAASGGGVLAGTMKTWTNDWSFGTFSIFKVGVGMLGSTDVWSGGLAGFLFTFLTRPTLYPALVKLTGITLAKAEDESKLPIQIMSPGHAQAVTTLVLIGVFSWKTFNVHYLPRAKVAAKKVVESKSEKQPKSPTKKQ